MCFPFHTGHTCDGPVMPHLSLRDVFDPLPRSLRVLQIWPPCALAMLLPGHDIERMSTVSSIVPDKILRDSLSNPLFLQGLSAWPAGSSCRPPCTPWMLLPKPCLVDLCRTISNSGVELCNLQREPTCAGCPKACPWHCSIPNSSLDTTSCAELSELS